MQSSLRTTAVLALGALALLPGTVSATHGDAGLWIRDNASFFCIGQYSDGAGNTQTWDFTCSGGAQCSGFGSIEVGFTGSCLGAGLGGTGHFHAYPNLPLGTCAPSGLLPVCVPDLHDVLVDGQPGKLLSN